jgi:hypothetical protein
MSKSDPSSSNAAGDKRPGRADGEAGRLAPQLAEQPEAATRPARSLDDSWALSAAMAVPHVPGVTDPSSPSSATSASGEADALHPAPPMIPAAAPSGAGSGRESAAASVVARAAALRALGSKTMQGFGPAPIHRGGKPGGALGLGAGAPSSAPSSSSAGDPEEEPTHFATPPSAAAAHRGGASQAPLYLDDPPDMLRLSTGTSDISVPEIDPGVSASMVSNAASSHELDDADDPRGAELDGGQHDDDGRDDGHDEDDGHDHTEDSLRHDAHDPHAGLHVPAAYSVDSAPYPQDSGPYPESSEPFPQDAAYGDDGQDEGGDEHGDHGDGPHHDGQHADYHDGGYRDSAPEAVPPVAQLLAPTTAARRAYGEDGVPRAESDWFEPSGAQAMADPSSYGHTAQQHDHSFTEPSRRNRPSGPNRWIAPVAVVVAIAAVVFAGGYFYTRGGPPSAQDGSAVATSEPTRAAGAVAVADPTGDTVAANGGPAPSSTVAAGLVDVRFDSTPPGAMVMLVDRGRGITSPVGTTPVRAALEPKGTYDAIFTLEGHPTKVVSLAGPKAARVVADLTGNGGEQAATAPNPGTGPTESTGAQPVPAGAGDKTEVAKVDEVKASAGDKPSGADQRDPRDKRKDKRTRTRVGATAPGGGDPGDEGDEVVEAAADDGSTGRLSISAKPPCEISINGKPTGRSTPVRDLPLSVGIHKITFINKSLGVNETIAVRVTAGKETKVAQDYTGTP